MELSRVTRQADDVMEPDDYPSEIALALYTLFFGMACLYWETYLVDPWIVFTSLALIFKVVSGSLKEGEKYWPRIEDTPKYQTARLVFHGIIVAGIVTTCIFLFIPEWRDTWGTSADSTRQLPLAWRWSLLITSLLYGLSSLPSIMALSNEELWNEDNRNDKRMLSISVLKEIVQTGFLLPLIHGASDIVDDADDSEWRHIAASLVFTSAVIYFIVFWYVTRWNIARPLENMGIIATICRGCGMLIIYVVFIRRLHENNIITSMNFTSDKDNVAIAGAFVCLIASHLIKLFDFWRGSYTVAVLILVLLLMFISIDI